MDNASKEDERLNASKIRGSRHLEDARTSGSGEHVASMGQREIDRRRRSHHTKRRDEFFHEKVPGALRIRASEDVTRRKRAVRGRLLICRPN